MCVWGCVHFWWFSMWHTFGTLWSSIYMRECALCLCVLLKKCVFASKCVCLCPVSQLVRLRKANDFSLMYCWAAILAFPRLLYLSTSLFSFLYNLYVCTILYPVVLFTSPSSLSYPSIIFPSCSLSLLTSTEREDFLFRGLYRPDCCNLPVVFYS